MSDHWVIIPVTKTKARQFDVAWGKAVAALPEGWRLVLSHQNIPESPFIAEARPPFLPHEEWMAARRVVYAATPIAALRALVEAVQVEAVQVEDGPAL